MSLIAIKSLRKLSIYHFKLEFENFPPLLVIIKNIICRGEVSNVSKDGDLSRG